MSRTLFSFFMIFAVCFYRGKAQTQLRRRLKHCELNCPQCLTSSFIIFGVFRLLITELYLTKTVFTSNIEKSLPALSILTRQRQGRQLHKGRWLQYSLLLFSSILTKSNRQKNTTRAFIAVASSARAPRPRISRSASHSQRDGRNPVLSLRGI
jgi:hypothetical protein